MADGDSENHKNSVVETSDLSEGILFGIGNPLLDISAYVEEDFLKKYGLLSNNAILAEEKHMPIYKELIDNHEVEYTAGGATQNSIKVAQWLLRKPKLTTFSGCIASDKYGETLNSNLEKLGVNTMYQYLPEGDKTSTGTCAVMITGRDRSLVTNLGAANCFDVSHLEQEQVWNTVKKAKYFYIAGFFLTVSMKSILKIARYAHEEKKIFGMNLSAAFLSRYYKEQMMQAMPYVDYLFGNETEAAALSKAMDFGCEETDVKSIAVKASELPKESSRKRIVVFTQGPDPVVVAQNGEAKEYTVPVVKDIHLVDTNGAGDAFVGGFLSQLVQGKAIDDCVRCGVWAAVTIIQRSGCTFPEVPDFS